MAARSPRFLLLLVLAACSGDVQRGPQRSGQPGGGPPGASGTPGAGGASAAGSGSANSTDSPPPPRPMSLAGDPIYSRFVRLTNEQWQRSVQDILGLDQLPEAASSFEQPV